ncbi:MAG: hypothetical protein IPP17_12505 [Bacteroidetes bacterium]|nr:hypothetical protein [Bacteroidota bacterium]
MKTTLTEILFMQDTMHMQPPGMMHMQPPGMMHMAEWRAWRRGARRRNF